jgi:hypothetical protein
MKRVLFFFVIFLIGCSQPKNQKEIEIFESALGEKNVEVLNLLVYDFETNLLELYPELELKDAYKQYLLDISDEKTKDFQKFLFQTEKTRTRFHESGFWDEIFYYEYYTEDIFNNSIDSTKSLQANNIGKYMIALYEIKNTDSLIYRYWNVREAAGLLSNEFFVKGTLSLNPDFDNYFHKRIVVIEYSF